MEMFVIYVATVSPRDGVNMDPLNAWKDIREALKDIKMAIIAELIKEDRTRNKNKYAYSISRIFISTENSIRIKEICSFNYDGICLLRWFDEDFYKENKGLIGKSINFSSRIVEIHEIEPRRNMEVKR